MFGQEAAAFLSPTDFRKIFTIMDKLETKENNNKKRHLHCRKNFKLRVAARHRNKLPKRTLVRQDADNTQKQSHSTRSTPTIVTYPVQGENLVNTVWYIDPSSILDKGIVWINNSQYFENVPPEVWHYCVGNYCVCQRWLKVREGSVLDRKSIQDFQRLVMLLSETIALMNNVDSQLK